MNAEQFTNASPGELTPILLGAERDWAFLPGPPPRDWSPPSAELHELLGDARERLGTLNGIGQTLLNPMLLLRPLQQREAIRSSSLEGTHVHALDLFQYQQDPEEPTSEKDERNAWREVENYNVALHEGLKSLDELPLCSRSIRRMHRKLLTGVRGLDKRPGEFRDRQVHIGSNRRFVPPPAEHVERLMAELERYLHDDKDSTNSLVRAYIAHYQFEAIHPFLDGNGRIGRVLLALCTFLWHRHSHPWLYMSAYFDRYKDEYMDGLFRVSTLGDWEGWIRFCLRGTVMQCEDTVRRCKQLFELRTQLHELADLGSPRMHQIIDALFEQSPVFKVRSIMDLCSTSRPTAQKDIRTLQELGVVEHLKGDRPQYFFVPKIIEAAYSEAEAS